MWFLKFLANLFSFSLFANGDEAPPNPITAYGFAWRPNTSFDSFQVTALHDNDTRGLYLAFEQQNIDSPQYFFDDETINVGVIYPLAPASVAFANAIQAFNLDADANLQQKLEGFLRYTHNCLTYIYATEAGQKLIDGLMNNGQHLVYVKPSNANNQIQGGGDKLCFVAKAVINSNLNLTVQDRALLLQELAQASGQADQPTQFQWLAQQVNQMPLYTLFEQFNAFPAAFLQTNNPVTAQNLADWFTNGSNSQFIQQLANVSNDSGVNLASCLKNAVIVALYTKSAAGAGGRSDMFFDVHNWSKTTLKGVDRTMNTVLDRPPAIGLAHELIHAYYNAIGREPGSEIGDFSTTLAECLCVGMGPAFAENAISENAIRAVWPPGNMQGNDQLNNRNPGARTIYENPAPQTAAQARQAGGMGGGGAI